MWVWRQRYEELGAREDVEYVLHLREPRRRGRRDAAPPARPDLRLPVPAAGARARARGRRAPRRLRAVRAARARARAAGGACCSRTTSVVAYVPYAARWPYEAHVVMREHRAEPARLRGRASCALLADALQALARGYDALFDAPVPVRDGRPPGADRGSRRARADGPPARRVLPAAAHRREAQVPRRLRAGRGHVHLRHAARGVRRRRCARRSPVPR